VRQEINQQEAGALFLDIEEGGDMFLRKCLLSYIGLHGVISQKTELFIVTAVGTSNSR
jgi:hypothetical protein